MEYKYCPNMIVIDTPGMLHAPKGPQLTPQQRQLAQAAKEAERLVARKISCKDYIILCVEDTTDWKHATTRNLVTQIDPDLTRTVLVTTKLDTKIPQFSEAQDLEDFLRYASHCCLHIASLACSYLLKTVTVIDCLIFYTIITISTLLLGLLLYLGYFLIFSADHSSHRFRVDELAKDR